ncbi:MAG: hypothetical protein M3544_03585 [Pseudomonadota bacterium]|nr:hypothetical protein [Pseudomonadota bacterium]
MLETAFWRNAYQSLPESIRYRYLAHLERAERWDLAIDGIIDAASRAKAALSKVFQTPRSAH